MEEGSYGELVGLWYDTTKPDIPCQVTWGTKFSQYLDANATTIELTDGWIPLGS